MCIQHNLKTKIFYKPIEQDNVVMYTYYVYCMLAKPEDIPMCVEICTCYKMCVLNAICKNQIFSKPIGQYKINTFYVDQLKDTCTYLYCTDMCAYYIRSIYSNKMFFKQYKTVYTLTTGQMYTCIGMKLSQSAKQYTCTC